MSKIDELKKDYHGYCAAFLAIKKTEPTITKVNLFYDVDDKDNPGQKKTIYPGYIYYDPKDDELVIKDTDDRCVCFRSAAIPCLIKAIRELSE